MNLFAPYAEKTAAALAKAEADFGRLSGQRDAHAALRPDGSDLDALIDWKRAAGDFDMRIEAAEEALAFAKAAAETQAVAAANAERDRCHSAAGKLATTHAKLTVEIAADAEHLAAKLTRLEEMRSTIEDANAVRENRPGIIDGETKVRQRMDKGRPAITEERTVWVDRDGTPVSGHTHNAEGRIVDNPRAVRQELRTFEVCPELPATPIPLTRFADAVRLIDLSGTQIWPPR
jgi:hypothetical protein